MSYRDLFLIGAVMALALAAREVMAYTVRMYLERKALLVEVDRLREKVESLSRKRDEIFNEAIGALGQRQENRAILEGLLIVDILNMVWQTNPPVVLDKVQQWINEHRRK